MKNLIFLVVSLICLTSHAEVVSVDSDAKIVNYQPTPDLVIETIDLEGDGAYLMYSLEYNSSTLLNEQATLESQYPGYKINRVTARPSTDTTFLTFGSLVSIPVAVRDGQYGPYINGSTKVSAVELKKIKENLPTQKVEMSIQTKAEVITTQILEQYNTTSDICSEISGSSVKEVILKLSQFQKPAGIKNSSTFNELKSQMLSKCVEIEAASVNSFKSLIGLKVAMLQEKDLQWTVKITQKRDETKEFLLKPTIKLNFK